MAVVTPAVQTAVREALTRPDESATAELALALARQIDAERGDKRRLTLERLAPLLLDCLEALHLTPRSRAKLPKGVETDAARAASRLDELRQRRDARATG